MRARYGVDAMPETAENVAEVFQISRADQDAFAFRSQMRARDAAAAGRFAVEIVAVDVPATKGDARRLSADEHPRADTTLEKLAKLPTPFRTGGTVTAGNASGVNDGAAAMLIASAEAVERHDLKPLARILGIQREEQRATTDKRLEVPAELLRKALEKLGDEHTLRPDPFQEARPRRGHETNPTTRKTQ